MMINGYMTDVMVRVMVPVPGLPPVAQAVYSAHALVISYWPLVALASILPLVAIWKRLQRWSADRRGLCPMCGYDVLEIACDQIQRSTRHESGFALRFPRIKRIRWDKRPEDADRLLRVREIYESTHNFGYSAELSTAEPLEPTLFD